MFSKIIFMVFYTTVLLASDNFKPASSCGECHQDIYEDWKTSMHAESAVNQDPLFRGMYELAIEDSKGKLRGKCIVCHSPLSIKFKLQDPAEAFNREGVTCQYCHSAKEISGIHSAQDIKLDLSTIYSHQPSPENEAHPVAHRDFFQTSEFCLPCHAAMKNPADLEVCSTGAEWREYYEKSHKTCQDCHMPRIAGVTSHRFPGTHQNNFITNTIDIQMSFDYEDSVFQVTLLNTGAGHALPTGTPLRMIYLKVMAFNKKGEVIWQNWKESPLTEDRSSLFMKILGDAEGLGPLPPWKATQILYDRRLLPEQPVIIEYHIAHQELFDIEAQLFYRFAPPQFIEKFNISDPHYSSPKLIGQKGLRITGNI